MRGLLLLLLCAIFLAVRVQSSDSIRAWDFGHDTIDADGVGGCLEKEIVSLPGENHWLCLRDSDLVSKSIMKKGYWTDCLDMLALWKAIHEGEQNAVAGVYVDIGANIGACSIAMASNGIYTIAIEPVPSNLHYLTKSVLLNLEKGRPLPLTLYPYAVVEHESTERVTMYQQPGNYGNSMANNPVADTDSKTGTESAMKKTNTTVHAFTADQILVPLVGGLSPNRNRKRKQQSYQSLRSRKSRQEVDILKIDVQGLETAVLKGAKHLLSLRLSKPKYIKSEIDPVRLFAQNTSALELVELLGNAGYVLMHTTKHYENSNFSQLDQLAANGLVYQLSSARTFREANLDLWRRYAAGVERASGKSGTLAADDFIARRRDMPAVDL